MASLEHEEIIVRAGPRSGLPVVVAIHSTRLGQAVGGCRIWRYPDWRDGLEDALRLSACMTRKLAVSGLANGGGKTVVAVPEGRSARRGAAGLTRFGTWARSSRRSPAATRPAPTSARPPRTWPSSANAPGTCSASRPELGGSGDSSPSTATGVVAALRAACSRTYGRPDLGGRRFAISGLGSVGGHLARQLTAADASLVVSDIDAEKKDLARGTRSILGRTPTRSSRLKPTS